MHAGTQVTGIYPIIIIFTFQPLRERGTAEDIKAGYSAIAPTIF